MGLRSILVSLKQLPIDEPNKAQDKNSNPVKINTVTLRTHFNAKWIII